jgi:hypothetical protein
LVALLTIGGCGHAFADRAVKVGQRSKTVVDGVASAVSDHINKRADACKERPTRVELDQCLGPVASRPDHVDAVLESVRAAQVVLYVAVAAGDVDAVKGAIADLTRSMAEVAKLARQIQEAK